MAKKIKKMFMNQLIRPNHRYRKFMEILDSQEITEILKPLISDNPCRGFGLLRLFKALFLQVLEDLRDRELEVFLEENNAGKWFCGFNWGEKTPDYSLFSKIRKKIGERRCANIFINAEIRSKPKGLGTKS
ncbi:hypothetical protein AGMMS49949_09730 [Alphaproteobacteria bacterium]|nr:hypothetical protein AGMMS49949_09730 [Alphaproteobacteria bacterium]